MLPESPGLERFEFDNSFSIPVVHGAWQKGRGRGYRWQDGRWQQFWETQPLDALFGACPMVDDYDGDGKPELVIRPWYELVLLDPTKGTIKDRCRFTEGRSYGLYTADDLNGDGKREFVVLADFAKHIDVLGYRGGKLSLLWQKNIELDISNPQKVLRIHVESIADLDGDGKKEIVANLYNDTGDRRWHLLVFDGMTGSVKADLVDEYFQGMADIGPGGRTAMLTTTASGMGVAEFGTIRVRILREGCAVSLWEHRWAGWQLARHPTPFNVNGTATLGNEGVLLRRVAGRVLTVMREPNGDAPCGRILTVLQWTGVRFEAISRAVGPEIEGVALDETGTLLLRCRTAPGVSQRVSTSSPASQVCFSSKESGSVGPVVLAQQEPRRVLIAAGAGEELVAFTPPGPSQDAPRELWRLHGRAQTTQWGSAQSGVAVADLWGDGRRQVLYATAAPSGCGRLVVAGIDSHEVWHHDFPWVPGTPPIWNTGGVLLWQTGHFMDRTACDVLVQVRRSMMHSEETVLLSGRDGSEIWRRARQVDNRGVGGAAHAIADFDGDGLDDVCQLHPSEFYIMKGTDGKDLVAMPATWQVVPAKPVYWGIPIAGDFENAGKSSVMFTGRSMTGLVRPNGSLVWWDALDKSVGNHAIGDFDGDGRLEAIGAGYEDGVRCYDTATGRIKWRVPSPLPGAASDSLSGDLNSDGRDEALLLFNDTLLCLAAAPDGKTGRVLWQLKLPARSTACSLVDLGGEQGVSILLQGDDGYVRCVR